MLEQQGQAEKAYQLRRYLLTQQRDALLALPDNAATYRYLVGLFTDARFARTLIENKVLAAHSNTTSGEKGQTAALSTADATALTSELFSQYLAENRADSVLFWQHRSASGVIHCQTGNSYRWHYNKKTNTKSSTSLPKH